MDTETLAMAGNPFQQYVGTSSNAMSLAQDELTITAPVPEYFNTSSPYKGFQGLSDVIPIFPKGSLNSDTFLQGNDEIIFDLASGFQKAWMDPLRSRVTFTIEQLSTGYTPPNGQNIWYLMIDGSAMSLFKTWIWEVNNQEVERFNYAQYIAEMLRATNYSQASTLKEKHQAFSFYSNKQDNAMLTTARGWAMNGAQQGGTNVVSGPNQVGGPNIAWPLSITQGDSLYDTNWTPAVLQFWHPLKQNQLVFSTNMPYFVSPRQTGGPAIALAAVGQIIDTTYDLAPQTWISNGVAPFRTDSIAPNNQYSQPSISQDLLRGSSATHGLGRAFHPFYWAGAEDFISPNIFVRTLIGGMIQVVQQTSLNLSCKFLSGAFGVLQNPMNLKFVPLWMFDQFRLKLLGNPNGVFSSCHGFTRRVAFKNPIVQQQIVTFTDPNLVIAQNAMTTYSMVFQSWQNATTANCPPGQYPTSILIPQRYISLDGVLVLFVDQAYRQSTAIRELFFLAPPITQAWLTFETVNYPQTPISGLANTPVGNPDNNEFWDEFLSLFNKVLYNTDMLVNPFNFSLAYRDINLSDNNYTGTNCLIAWANKAYKGYFGLPFDLTSANYRNDQFAGYRTTKLKNDLQINIEYDTSQYSPPYGAIAYVFCKYTGAYFLDTKNHTFRVYGK